MRFKYGPQLPGAGRTWAGHHHGNHTPTSTGAIFLVKWHVNQNILAASVLLDKQDTLILCENVRLTLDSPSGQSLILKKGDKTARFIHMIAMTYFIKR